MSSLPQSLKFLIPYLARANEIKRAAPKMYYYVRVYALTKAVEKLRAGELGENGQSSVIMFMDAVEKERSELNINIESEKAKAYVQVFALRVFKAANDEDLAGMASKKTARAFYAASIFLESLKQFGNLSNDNQEKIKYSKWKTTYLLKCFREGRQPIPGPPGGIKNENNPEIKENKTDLENTDSGEDSEGDDISEMKKNKFTKKKQGDNNLSKSEGNSFSSLSEQEEEEEDDDDDENLKSKLVINKLKKKKKKKQLFTDSDSESDSDSDDYDYEKIDQARKYTKQGLSSLDFNDIPSAIQKYQLVIKILKELENDKKK
ncbi:vacuolar protein sorting-associated protein vta1 [Anaeramoeba flamelloides]|uniref:Vacuolar protein sorting-associated protein vta1 n=1 Tax=Anaeramoeba flamelloides TaxID=1746091 RepID=A0AAV7Z616_9EUKA|nr:vacuolar protein sorting-associated protein vta1 [Anaeramoeba flamelloides]